MYSLGDYLYLTGNDYSTSTSNYYYSYSEYVDTNSGYASINEYYSWYYGINSSYYESYNYSSEYGNFVDYISMNGGNYIYDGRGRLRSSSSFGDYEYDYGSYSQGYWDTSTTYNYNPYGYTLNNSISTSNYTDIYASGVYTNSSTTKTRYRYSSPNDGMWDYDYSRSISEHDNDGDGNIDQTTYELAAQDDYYNSYSNSYISVTYENGIQTNSDITDSDTFYTQWGSISNYDYEQSQDWDGDGIVNYTYDSNNNYFYNYNSDLYRYENTWFSEYDWDYDGFADYMNLVEEYNNGYVSQKVEKTWNNNTFSPDTMTISVSLDYNNDGIYDSTFERQFIRYLSSDDTYMGGHIATFQDTLI